MSEPTLPEVRDAVFALPSEYVNELAQGSLLDPDDPDSCRICDLFDDYVYDLIETPHTTAVLTLVDYHRFYGSPNRDGRGPEAYRRCQEIYAFAREARVDREARDAA